MNHEVDELTLFVDHSRNTLDTTSSSKTTDSWLGDTLDVVSQDLSVSLGTTLAEALATFAASSHDEGCLFWKVKFESGKMFEAEVLVWTCVEMMKEAEEFRLASRVLSSLALCLDQPHLWG